MEIVEIPNAIWIDLFIGQKKDELEYVPMTHERVVVVPDGKFHVDRKELHAQFDLLINKVKNFDEYLIKEQAEKWREQTMETRKI